MVLFGEVWRKSVLPHMKLQELCSPTLVRSKYWERAYHHLDLVLLLGYQVVDVVGCVYIYASNCATPFATTEELANQLGTEKQDFLHSFSNHLFHYNTWN